MKRTALFFIAFLLSAIHTLQAQIMVGSQVIDTTTVISKLHVPWEIIWGQDNFIWFTERNGQVKRLDPVSKKVKTILKMTDVIEQSESGLLGMALHPNFKDSSFVYLAYNYSSGGAIKERVVCYTYTTDTLINRFVLIENLAGSGNHNGSRLIITPDRKILITTGDAQSPSLAQNNSSLSGKILRLNLDGSIPSDNPIKGSPIWTKGHRNPQGLVLAPNGILYSSEHGPNNDDEFNIIKKGRNYGWPNVEGFCNTSAENKFCKDSNVVEPSYGWTPTLAVAGIDYYNSTAIKEWNNCILMTTLKEADFRVLQLNAAGDEVTKVTTFFDNWFGRLRDICIAPNGDIYIATSNRDGRASSPFPKKEDDRIIKIAPATGSNTPFFNSAAQKEIKIVPNPMSDQSLISIANADDNEYKITLYNLLGEEIKHILIQGNASGILNKENMPQGLYLYSVTSKNELVANGKLIVN